MTAHFTFFDINSVVNQNFGSSFLTLCGWTVIQYLNGRQRTNDKITHRAATHNALTQRHFKLDTNTAKYSTTNSNFIQ